MLDFDGHNTNPTLKKSVTGEIVTETSIVQEFKNKLIESPFS